MKKGGPASEAKPKARAPSPKPGPAAGSPAAARRSPPPLSSWIVPRAPAGGAAAMAVDWSAYFAPAPAEPAPAATEPLDRGTRDRIERTTGRVLPDVTALRDQPDLAARGVAGEARGRVIRLSPRVPGPETPFGMRVRLHEAAHVLQFEQHASGAPAAPRAEVEGEAWAVAGAALRGEAHPITAAADGAEPHEGLVGDIVGGIVEGAEVVGGVIAGAGEAVVEFVGEAYEAITDPMGWLRKHFPALADLIDNGFASLLPRLAELAGSALEGVIKGLGLDQIGKAFFNIYDQLSTQSQAFGVLTGCCECLDGFLKGLLESLKGLLSSEGAQAVRQTIIEGQERQSDQDVGLLADFFGFLKSIGEPVMAVIDAVVGFISDAIELAGAAGQKLWEIVGGWLGLDTSLSPLEAVKKALAGLWQQATELVQPIIDAVNDFIAWVKNDSPLAPLFRAIEQIPVLLAALGALWEEKKKDAKAWLASAAEFLQTVIFEPVLRLLAQGRAALRGAAEGIKAWFAGILDKLGILQAWETGLGFVDWIVRGAARAAEWAVSFLAGVGEKVAGALETVAAAAATLAGYIRPLLEFCIGLAIAVFMTLQGNVFALPLFLLGTAWRLLPECYKIPILHFLLDVFIAIIEWIPAAGDTNFAAKAIRSAALGYLRALRSQENEQRIVKAVDLIASIFTGNLEFLAGLLVGILKGIYESTIGTVVFIFQAIAWVAQLGWRLAKGAGRAIHEFFTAGTTTQVEESEDAEGGGDESEGGAPEGEGAARETEEPGAGDEAGAPAAETVAVEELPQEIVAEAGPDEIETDAPLEDEEPEAVGPLDTEESGEEAGEAGEEAEGGERTGESPGPAGEADERMDAPPEVPSDLPSGRELLEKIFVEGITREELQEFFKGVGTGLEEGAEAAGAEAANALLDALNAEGAAYAIGEVVGVIVGMVVTEVVIIVFTGGAGSAKTAVTGAKVMIKAGRHLPTLARGLRMVMKAVKPLLRALARLKKTIGRWAKKVMKFLDDLFKWVKRQLAKLLRRGKKAKPKLKPKVKPRTRPKKPRRRKPGSLKDDAIRAAMTAWRTLQPQLAGAVHRDSSVKSRLRSIRVMAPPGARVTLSLHRRGTTWRVKATVRKGAKWAKAKWGRGWVTKDLQHRAWLATRSSARLHRDVMSDSIRDLKDVRNSARLDLRRQYDTEKRDAAQIEQRGQQRIAQALRGIRFSIEMEDFRRVENDYKITTELLITPNAKKKKVEVELEKKLLPGEGRVGTFRELTRLGKTGDHLTPHHMPADKYMAQHGVSRNDGVSMMVEQPAKGGRHRRTRSYGAGPDLSETPQEALQGDVADLGAIYLADGLLTTEIQASLVQVVALNYTLHPKVFGKAKK